LAVTIEREGYDVAQQGITYLASYAGRIYSCVVHLDDLGLHITGEVAKVEFRRRVADVKRATEEALQHVRGWRPGTLVRVRLDS
jgi:hypothetical protein